MYAGRDFDPSDSGESELYSFDFVNDLPKGDQILSVVWTCAVAAKSEATEDDAASRIDGVPEFLGTKTTQRVTGLVAGVTYVLKATITTAKPETISLWSHVECKAPA